MITSKLPLIAKGCYILGVYLVYKYLFSTYYYTVTCTAVICHYELLMIHRDRSVILKSYAVVNREYTPYLFCKHNSELRRLK